MVNKLRFGLIGLAALIYSPSNVNSEEVKNVYNLSSTLQNVHQGTKDDGKYHLDGTLLIKNNGTLPVEDKYLCYSICPRSKDGKVGPNCITGSGGNLDRLEPGQELSKRLALISFGNDVSGLYLKLTVQLRDLPKKRELFIEAHDLGEVTAYK